MFETGGARAARRVCVPLVLGLLGAACGCATGSHGKVGAMAQASFVSTEQLDPSSLSTQERLVRVYLQGDDADGRCQSLGLVEAVSARGSGVTAFISNVAKLRRVTVARGGNTVRVIDHVRADGTSHTSAESLRCGAPARHASL